MMKRRSEEVSRLNLYQNTVNATSGLLKVTPTHKSRQTNNDDDSCGFFDVLQ